MRLPRFSIASLGRDCDFAVALAALRSPSYLWANVTFSLGVGALVVAIVNIIYGQEAGRAYWLGFSLCGGIYLALCSMPGLRDSVCPRLVTEVFLTSSIPLVAMAALSPGVTVVATTITVTGITLVRCRGLALGHIPIYVANVQASPSPRVPPLTAWTEPDRTVGVGYQIGTVSLNSAEAFASRPLDVHTARRLTRWDLRPPSISDRRKGQIGVGIRCVCAHSHTPLHGGAACGVVSLAGR